MIIAIYGPSCTGKTTIARELSQRWKLPARFCGQEVSHRALERGCAPQELPREEHEAIDHETVRWVANHRTEGGIIEGRYLNYVLSGNDQPILLVECRCSEKERENRIALRIGKAAVTEILLLSDEQDRRFVLSTYSGVSATAPTLILDTSELSIDQCINEIQKKVSANTRRG